MIKKALWVSVTLLLFAMALQVSAENIRIVCPYVGLINNIYEDSGQDMELDDDGLLAGLFFQWVNPDHYQWNAFIYQASDVNYSTLWGGHFIFDYYFAASKVGKSVIGAGIEYIRIDMNAEDEIEPLEDFELVNNIIVPYFRSGYRFEFKPSDVFTIAVFPWGGVQYEAVSGDMSMMMDPPGPAPATLIEDEIDDDDIYGMAGLNVRARIFHMLELECKGHYNFAPEAYPQTTISAMANVYFTRHWGLSYRMKFMELSNGSNLYNIFGIAYVF